MPTRRFWTAAVFVICASSVVAACSERAANVYVGGAGLDAAGVDSDALPAADTTTGEDIADTTSGEDMATLDGGQAEGDTSGGDAAGDVELDASPPAPWATCPGGKRDPSTQLCWQDPPQHAPLLWPAAATYCEALTAGAKEDWRLPDISELRSLIRGCADTETGGKCPTTAQNPKASSACGGCAAMGGPADGGCYWSPSLSGSCASSGVGTAGPSFWSATVHPGLTGFSYAVDFSKGGLVGANVDSIHGNARCVRTD